MTCLFFTVFDLVAFAVNVMIWLYCCECHDVVVFVETVMIWLHCCGLS